DVSNINQKALYIGGTNAADVIEVRRGSSTTMVEVMINGVSRGQFSTSGLARIIVYGNAGDDTITINTNIGAIAAYLYGEEGNDTLRAGAGISVLDGGLGNDQLFGGASNDFLVGGAGSDTSSGGGGDDIMLGGIYSMSEDLDAAAAILSTWSQGGYTTRIQSLKTGVGQYGVYKLDSRTVFDDAATDSLTGATGDDWFIASSADKT